MIATAKLDPPKKNGDGRKGADLNEQRPEKLALVAYVHLSSKMFLGAQ
jgi:hypothetical protein